MRGFRIIMAVSVMFSFISNGLHAQFDCIAIESYDVLSRVPTETGLCNTEVELCLKKNKAICSEIYFQINFMEGSINEFIDVSSAPTGTIFCHVFSFLTTCSGSITLTGYGMTESRQFCGVWSTFFPLPVELVSFEAKALNESIVIEWEVAQEDEIQEYVVEKINSKFQPIGRVKPESDGQENQVYFFTDVHAKDGLNQYRLKIVEKSGGVSYSEVVVVNFADEGALSEALIYPQPAQNYVTIESDDEVKSFLSSSGQNFNVESTSDQRIDISQLPSGLYMVLGTNKVIGKIVKQ